jgi:hypothetical protein
MTSNIINLISTKDVCLCSIYNCIYRITAVLKVETYIIASITTSPIGRAVMLVVMYVEIFKTKVIVLLVTS